MKKIFSIMILILFLLNNLIPVITYATDNEGTTNSEDTRQEEIERKYEIKEEKTWDISAYGDGSIIAKWTLKDRTLTISGSGEIKNWSSYSEIDWHNKIYKNIIEKVVIENGITNLGEYMFYNCSSLTNIEIPNSVKSISSYAFSGCSSLTNIEIPNSVTSIGSYAFSGCSSLTNIEIPSSVKSIEESIFEYCSSLTNIEIPNSVTSIGSDAFKDCSSLTNIEIPSSVTIIWYNAFSGCSSLTNIEIPSSVTSIRESAFWRCNSLREIKVDGENQKYTSIDGVLFNKDKTELITFPSGKKLTKYILPNGVISIGYEAFKDCSSLTNIEIPNSVTSIDSSAFWGCSNLTNIEIPNSVTSIDSSAFWGCSNLTNIEIPSSVTSIGGSAFRECSSLTSIEIPNSVTSIDSSAFWGCSNLTNIEMPSSVTSIGADAFRECSSLTNIEIQNSVTSIGDRAFYNCRGPIICKTNSEAHRYAEEEKNIYILQDEVESSYSTNYKAKDADTWDISKNGDKSVIAKWSLEDRTLTISGSGDMKDWENTTTEDWRGTKYKKVIEKVIIENGITSIGRYAFSGCSSLTSIEIPNSVTNIGDDAFSRCSSLTNIEIPNSVTSIGDDAFWNCSSLTSIEIPNGVTSIGDYEFYGCKSLTNIEIPSSVTRIESHAFCGCRNLMKIEISSSVTKIESYAFEGCKSLTSIEIPNGVTSIGDYEFYGCKSLTNIEIPNSVTSIGKSAFSGCSSLTNIKIPSSVKSIGENTFSGCSNLSEINVDKENQKYTSIDGVLFNNVKTEIISFPNKKEMTQYIIPSSVIYIENYAFLDCSNLKSIEIPNNVIGMGIETFKGCSSLINIKIPRSLVRISDKAFSGCNNLKNIKISDSVTSIGYSALSDCKGPIICKTNSEAHRYAEEGKVGYLLDEEPPEIVFTPKEYNKSQKQVSIKVDVTDLKVGVDESSLKYIWSKKEEVSKEEVKTSFTNASQIASPEKVTGTYYLHIYALDIFGNETIVKSNAIRLDNTPPVITGVSNKKIHFGKAKPIITDDNPIEVELIKDGTKVTTYTNGAEITGVGKYKITATDEVGNTAEAEFEIEKIPDGKDGINYAMNPSELTNQDVKLTLSKKDETRYADLKIQVSTDGENYEDVTEKTIEQNGKIYARYAIDELVGVPLEIEIKNIDKTAAETEVTYSKTELTKENVQATITANEKVQAINGWILSSDGLKLTKEYEQNTEIDGEKVIVKDLAGNEKETIIKITNIDKEAPKVTGVQNGKSYSKKATPIVEDENLDTVKLIKKEKKTESTESDDTQTSTGENTETNPVGTSEEIIETEVEGYKNGDTITELGDYKIIATDKVENTTIVEFSIKEIPDTKDVVNITKTPEGLTNQDVIVTISKKEDEEYKDLKIETSIDNKNYEEVETATKTITITLTENGTIYVRAVKGEIIGETLEVKVDNIDKIEPTANITYSITELTTQNVDVTISTNEKVQGVSGWTLSNDGLKLTKTYTANTKENGEEIVIKDLVGNETKKIIKVTNIDKTAPTITGITNNQKYFRKATPKITDENINTIELTKDGEKVTNYTNGQEITGAGDYKLTATDKVGNSTIVNFSIYDIQTDSYKEKTAGNVNYLGKINVGEKTSKIETLLKNVSSYKITRNGTEIYSSTNKNNNQDLATGDKIEFESQTYTIIVTGDINKDGKANIIDLAKCMKVVLGKKTLDTIEGLAADTNFDGKVNIVDLAKIRKLSLNN